jgi:hypothetical protein
MQNLPFKGAVSEPAIYWIRSVDFSKTKEKILKATK